MLWTLAIVLLILWALGFGVFKVAGGLIHLLLLVALALFLFNLVRARRRVAG